MSDFKPNEIVYRNNYGRINCKLAEMLEKRKLTRNRIQVLSESSYEVIKRYYDNEDIRYVDVDLMARLCYILKCDLSDLLEYVPGMEGKTSD